VRTRLLLAALLGACGGDAGPAPPDLTATVADTTLVLGADPLTLRIERGGDVVLEAAAFVEIGVADPIDENHYYDPAAPDDAVEWRIPRRATTVDDGVWTLEGGARLSLAADGAMTVDAGAVDGAVLTRFVLPLADGEDVHGLGALLDGPGSRGKVREMQLRVDQTSPSSLNEVHVPVPLALYPARALGFFAENTRPGAFDVGAARADRMLVTFATPSLALVPFAGAPFEMLDAYTARTGRPRVPPLWAFAPFQWRNDSVDGAEVLADARDLRAHDIPGSCIWIDNPWQTGYNTFVFESERFPGAGAMGEELRALGFHLMVWSTPYVNVAEPTAADHAEAAALGYLVRDYAGRPLDFPWQDGPGALVDFSAPGATDWWRERIARVVDDTGVRGFKLDFGEDLVPDLGGTRLRLELAGGTNEDLHAHYAGLYHEAYLGALPEGDGFLLTRAGAWGTQTQTTCIWPGDLDNDFSRHDEATVGGLPAAISVMLSLSASGFPFYGSDIGGFRGGVPTGESLIRWAEYAALGTVMQLGGGGGRGTSHNPWDEAAYGPEALPIYRRYARLHTDLFPTLYSLALEAGRSGRPVTFAPGLLDAAHPYEDAFLVGDALFVAPVVEPGATERTVTLPPGDWIDWWTGETASGRVTVPAPLDTLPLWRKVGQIVVLLASPIDTFLPSTDSAVVSWADLENRRRVRVLVAPSAQSRFALWDGGTLQVEDAGASVSLSASPGSTHDDFRFELDWSGAPPGSATVPSATDVAALDACAAPGCWTYDAASSTAYVRLTGATTATLSR
jgi:alpha-D-xyloside xylohydrolase